MNFDKNNNYDIVKQGWNTYSIYYMIVILEHIIYIKKCEYVTEAYRIHMNRQIRCNMKIYV